MFHLSQESFQRLGHYVYTQLGIKMPQEKKVMMEMRLLPRVKALGLEDLEAYCTYFFSKKGLAQEQWPLVDAITTNKTDFFRESIHFKHLVDFILPEWLEAKCSRENQLFRLWSAGCSTGEEPYSMAMVLSEALAERPFPPWTFNILATDISPAVLKVAKEGVYSDSSAKPIPEHLLKKFVRQSKDRDKALIRIVPELRQQVKFKQVNFAEHNFKLRQQMDVIFCRNVMIYFDKTMQLKLLQRFCQFLATGGYLILGHTETTHGFDLPLMMVHPTIYKKV